jgi:hypothetical protein
VLRTKWLSLITCQSCKFDLLHFQHYWIMNIYIHLNYRKLVIILLIYMYIENLNSEGYWWYIATIPIDLDHLNRISSIIYWRMNINVADGMVDQGPINIASQKPLLIFFQHTFIKHQPLIDNSANCPTVKFSMTLPLWIISFYLM